MVERIDSGKRPDAYSAAAFIQGIQVLFHIRHFFDFQGKPLDLFFARINETGKAFGKITKGGDSEKPLDLRDAHVELAVETDSHDAVNRLGVIVAVAVFRIARGRDKSLLRVEPDGIRGDIK